MKKTIAFDDIRPYYDEEINEAMKRIVADPRFKYIYNYIFPDHKPQTIKKLFLSVDNIDDFQVKIMYPCMKKIIEKSARNVSYDGFQQLKNNQPYLFISNHRDIVLDSALLQILLYENHLKRSEITFGSNLMIDQFIIDIGKSNKMFKVLRKQKNGASLKQFFLDSIHLSEYIKYTINEKQESIWIAQRNGRTKDGNDITEPALIKMLALSNKDMSLVDFYKNLRIVPVSISYQYETCVLSKAKETFYSKQEEYQKSPTEDFESVIQGITEQKGDININISPPIQMNEFDCNIEIDNSVSYSLCDYITKQIRLNYKLFNNNYIAYDLINNSLKYNNKYSNEDLKNFNCYIEQIMHKVIKNKEDIKKTILEIYANPVINVESIINRDNFYNKIKKV